MTPRDPLTAAAEERVKPLMWRARHWDADDQADYQRELEMLFRAGATWTLAHHPKVQGLVEALEHMRDADDCPTAFYMIANQALAAFREKEMEK